MKKLSMKKTTAAAVTAAVGAALLLGGAGTLAYWTDEVEGESQTISAGDLALAGFDDGSWTYVADDSAVTKIVPGDVIETTVDVPVELVGDNIKADLSVAEKDGATTDGFGDVLDIAIDVNESGDSTYSFTEEFDATVPVTVTVTFPWDASTDATADNSTKLADYVFTLEYTLTQK